MATKYVGKRSAEGCEVTKEADGGQVEPLDPRLDLWNHSPAGFEWSVRRGS